MMIATKTLNNVAAAAFRAGVFASALVMAMLGGLAKPGQAALAQEVDSERPQALTFKTLDKITARTTTYQIAVGESATFGSLKITVRYCRSRPPEEPPETFAFLEITDDQRTGDVVKVFSGWMIASSPGWNALEHPVYDVWVISCGRRVETDQ